jgi:hypothetical protein
MPTRSVQRILELPFAILIDSAEQQPFEFKNLRADADKKYRTYRATTERVCLGRYPDSLGDYSLSGALGHCHVERKGQGDAYSTFLGFGRHGTTSRYERFRQELENLSRLESALIVVECPLQQLLLQAPKTERRSAQENARMIFRSILAWQQDYHVQWAFCESRRMAEITTFRWLYRWWEKHLKPSEPRQQSWLGKRQQADEKLLARM